MTNRGGERGCALVSSGRGAIVKFRFFRFVVKMDTGTEDQLGYVLLAETSASARTGAKKINADEVIGERQNTDDGIDYRGRLKRSNEVIRETRDTDRAVGCYIL